MPRLTELPHGISERLMTLKYQLQDKSFLHVISAYAPTLSAEQQTKEAFYEQLENLLTHIPKSHRVILLGDFNARVGRNAEIWPGVIGPHGIGNINSNGELLMTKCIEHNLTITNTQFRQRNKYKGTWQHRRTGHWLMIDHDHIIVKKKHLKEVKITKAITNIECSTDHRIVISKMTASSKPSYRKKKLNKTRTRINTERLQSQAIVDQLRQDVDSRLTDLTTNDRDDVETLWAKIRDSLYVASISVVGVTENKKQEDWFTENLHQIQPILDEKHNAFQSIQNNPNNENLKKFDDRKVWPLKDENGNLIKDKNLLKERWRDQYSTILNQHSATDDRAISLLPQYDLAMPLDNEITLEKIKEAISYLKNNKESSADQIPAEVYKALVNQGSHRRT
ncbi:uncharacterized protein LOC123315962 [Coccinella septempunctata]|uniref:uncharacterized protein LOC123315962 n=1 Tax=Coccinella septempunctata TaxID=41139 RepID=UPI001D089172|nr:uncharacterized protein LOC123315962 [Coccinella septempunctata]